MMARWEKAIWRDITLSAHGTEVNLMSDRVKLCKCLRLSISRRIRSELWMAWSRSEFPGNNIDQVKKEESRKLTFLFFFTSTGSVRALCLPIACVFNGVRLCDHLNSC